MSVRQEKFSHKNEYGVSFDNVTTSGVLSHTLHVSIECGEHQAFMICWYPPGVYDVDNAFYKAFPKMRPHDDEPSVSGRLDLWLNWEAAF
jgi:hypothetical protein